MKRVINGKTYNTETADRLAYVGNHRSSDDFTADYTDLYRTKSGIWFVAGCSGPAGQWARRLDDGMTGGGEGIRVISEGEARALVEEMCPVEDYILLFGEPEEA